MNDDGASDRVQLLWRLWDRIMCALGRHRVVDILEDGGDTIGHCPDCGASWTITDDSEEVKL